MQEVGALVQALLIIVFVGGLSLLAQWGRKNRSAEISLIVIILFLSLLVAGSGLLVALVARSGVLPPDVPLVLSAGGSAVLVVAGLIGVALCVPPLRRIMSRRTATAEVYPASPGSGEAPTRRFWSDPVIFFALWLSVLVLAQNLATLMIFTFSPGALEATFSQVGALSPVSIVASQLPFVVVAAIGVGFGYRRNLRETLARLGYGPITLRQLGVVGLFVVGSLLLSFAFNALFAALQPDLYERVGRVSEGLINIQGLSPLTAILLGLLIGIGAAAGEETLFRGALQPALGIPLASLLWVSLHYQYGPSLALLHIFVVSIAWGILRNRVNTTATFLVHAGYNFSLVVLSYFVQI